MDNNFITIYMYIYIPIYTYNCVTINGDFYGIIGIIMLVNGISSPNNMGFNYGI
jgi:hypothetical protein